jgi:hypothetical protein
MRELLATWLVERRHPIVAVESKSFRDFAGYLNPLAVGKLPKSGNTCRADIMKCFQSAKQTIKERVRIAKSAYRLISGPLQSNPRDSWPLDKQRIQEGKSELRDAGVATRRAWRN